MRTSDLLKLIKGLEERIEKLEKKPVKKTTKKITK